MNIEIEATDTITTIDGVPVRLWKGWTENGIACAVMVHRIAVLHSEDATEFDSQLKEQLPPGNSMPFYDALAQWREQLEARPARATDLELAEWNDAAADVMNDVSDFES